MSIASSQNVQSTSALVAGVSFYHGAMSTADVISLLVNGGDFLVQLVQRANDCKTKQLISGPLLVLSARCVDSNQKTEKIRHWLIKHINGKVGIENAVFSSIPEMVQHYVSSQESIVQGEEVSLKNPVLFKTEIQGASKDELSSKKSDQQVVDVSGGDKLSLGSDDSTEQVQKEKIYEIFGDVLGMDKLSLGRDDNISRDKVVESPSASTEDASTKLSLESDDSTEQVRKYRSDPVQASWVPLTSSELDLPKAYLVSEPNSTVTEKLSDTWPSLRLFNSSEVVCNSIGQKTSSLSTELYPATSSIENIGNNKKVSFSFRDQPSYETIRRCTPRRSEPVVEAFDYESVDKLELRYKIAKASSFYEFVKLYNTSQDGKDAMSMPTIIRLAELVFQDYQNHALSLLDTGKNA